MATTNPSVIAVTCGSGKQAAHLIPHFYNDTAYLLRLVVHSEKSMARLKSEYPRAEVVQAELCEPADCRRVMQGVTSIFYVGPPLHAHETAIGYNMIDAAVHESRQSGSKFQHFVYSSVLNTQIRKLMNHDCKRYVEEYLMESGLKWTILQPTNFMDVWPVEKFMNTDANEIEHPFMWEPSLPNAQIALFDLADAGAKVLREKEKHFYAQYPLSSTMPISTQEAADQVGKVIGKKIVVKKLDYADAQAYLLLFTGNPRSENPPRLTIDAAQRLVLYYDNHSLNGNPNVLRSLLGREPIDVSTWTTMQVEKVKNAQK